MREVLRYAALYVSHKSPPCTICAVLCFIEPQPYQHADRTLQYLSWIPASTKSSLGQKLELLWQLHCFRRPLPKPLA